jgi:hypothetical protein
MKKKTKEIVHAMMTSLLVVGPALHNIGICHQEYAHIEALGDDEEDELTELMSEWPEFSGNQTFPVPACTKKKMDPGDKYVLRKDFWNKKSAYGRARWRLVAWLHDQTKPNG